MIGKAEHAGNQKTENRGSSETGPEYPRPEPGEVFLYLPGLKSAPPIGGGCCAMTAEDAVRDELASWPAITVTEMDLHAERVTVRIDPAADDHIADAVEALHDLGLSSINVVRAI